MQIVKYQDGIQRYHKFHKLLSFGLQLLNYVLSPTAVADLKLSVICIVVHLWTSYIEARQTFDVCQSNNCTDLIGFGLVGLGRGELGGTEKITVDFT